MRYIEWRSNSSDLFDIEGFQVVSRGKKKNKKKKKSPGNMNSPEGGMTLWMEKCLVTVLGIV
jgi:hypothetical protein